jgi:hypothetical protein
MLQLNPLCESRGTRRRNTHRFFCPSPLPFLAIQGVDTILAWEPVADAIAEAGWSWRFFYNFNPDSGFVFCIDASRDGSRHIVRSDDMLAAFLQLQQAIATID